MSLNFTTGHSSHTGAATTDVGMNLLLMLVFGREERGGSHQLLLHTWFLQVRLPRTLCSFSPGVVHPPGLLLTQFTSGPSSRHTKKFLFRTFINADRVSSTYPSCVSFLRAPAGAATGVSLSQSSACGSVRRQKTYKPHLGACCQQGSEAPALAMGYVTC